MTQVEVIPTEAFYQTKIIDFLMPPKLTTIEERAFFNCTSLDGYLIFSPGVIEIGNESFSYCSSLEEFTLSESLEEFPHPAFANSLNIRFVIIPEENLFLSSITGVVYDKNQTEFIYVPPSIRVNVTIPYNVRTIPERTFYKRDLLTCDIDIPNGIFEIGKEAFYGCSQITAINLPVSMIKINESAFAHCVNARGVVYVTDHVTYVGESCFEDTQITECYIGGVLEAIPKRMFADCTALDYLFIGQGVISFDNSSLSNTSSLRAIEVSPDNTYLYSETDVLYELNHSMIHVPAKVANNISIPNWCITIPEYSFYERVGIISITFRNGLETIGNYSFSNCSMLSKSLILPKSVKTIGNYAFYNDSEITDIVIDLTTESLNYIGDYAFYNLNLVTGALTIPDSVTYLGDYSFYGCNYNKALTISENVVDIKGNAFQGNDFYGPLKFSSKVESFGDGCFKGFKLTGILTIPSTTKSIGKSSFENTYFRQVIFESCETIGEKAFYNCSLLEKDLIIPNSTITIGQYAFALCPRLKGHLYTGLNVQMIDETIFYGSPFTTVEFGENLLSIGRNSFKDFPLTGEIHIPDKVQTLGDSSFEGCTSITYLYIGKNVISIGDNCFKGCTQISNEITLPQTLQSLGEYSFYDCRLTGPLAIPYLVVEIPKYCFAFNKFTQLQILEETTVQKNFFGRIVKSTSTCLLTKIDEHAFEFCDEISNSLTFPESLEFIGDYAFFNCTKLGLIDSTLRFNYNIEYIGEYSFSGCLNLIEIYFTKPPNGEEEKLYEIGNNAFEGVDIGCIENFPLTTCNETCYNNSGITYDLIMNHNVCHPKEPNYFWIFPTALSLYGTIGGLIAIIIISAIILVVCIKKSKKKAYIREKLKGTLTNNSVNEIQLGIKSAIEELNELHYINVASEKEIKSLLNQYESYARETSLSEPDINSILTYFRDTLTTTNELNRLRTANNERHRSFSEISESSDHHGDLLTSLV